MSTSTVRKQLLTNLRASKEYREGFVAEHIKTTIPFQLRAIRKKLGWTQKQLGAKANMAPERITVLEDPNYAKSNLSTLLRLADALDVALIVRFAPFSELLNWASNLSADMVAVDEFSKDKGLSVAAKQTIDVQDTAIWELTRGKKKPAEQSPYCDSSSVGFSSQDIVLMGGRTSLPSDPKRKPDPAILQKVSGL